MWEFFNYITRIRKEWDFEVCVCLDREKDRKGEGEREKDKKIDKRGREVIYFEGF